MILSEVHQQILPRLDEICQWFNAQTGQLNYPIYSSYDIRDSGFKVANVDANIYPAGFNNICPVDKETTPDHFSEYLQQHYEKGLKKILLITEEHTNNAYYWENVWTIQDLLRSAGMDVLVALAKTFDGPIECLTSSGKLVMVYSGGVDAPIWKEFGPDLVISNNDFSDPYEEWAQKLITPMNPPRELGWYQRRKSRYFENYNRLVDEFSEVAKIDPFIMRVETEAFLNFDIKEDSSRSFLAERVDLFLENLEKNYRMRGIDQKPFVFVKNNAGTYGLAVSKVMRGQEVLDWNYKSRKKMKAAKGGREVEEVIIQEGIPSVLQKDGASAEPVIYMVGCQLAGGFLRTHSEKSSTESLNAPGAIYKRLCVSDLLIRPEGCPLENVYGWTAKLGLLAIGLEASQMKVDFKGFIKKTCSRDSQLK